MIYECLIPEAWKILCRVLSSSKAYRIFNKRILCIEKSGYVVFDESGNLKSTEIKNDDDLFEFFKAQNNEVNRIETEVNLESHVVDPSPSEKVKEDNYPTIRPSPSHSK